MAILLALIMAVIKHLFGGKVLKDTLETYIIKYGIPAGFPVVGIHTPIQAQLGAISLRCIMMSPRDNQQQHLLHHHPHPKKLMVFMDVPMMAAKENIVGFTIVEII